VLVSRKAGETPPVAESIRETTIDLRRDVDLLGVIPLWDQTRGCRAQSRHLEHGEELDRGSGGMIPPFQRYARWLSNGAGVEQRADGSGGIGIHGR
jgi:hypothetical protein